MRYEHTPVLLKEVMDYLRPQVGDTIVDATLGGGGYTVAISRAVGVQGKVLAIDADAMAIQHFSDTKQKHLPNVIVTHDNFSHLTNVLERNRVDAVAGVTADLGLSSAQLQDRNRGFSFGMDAPLDMSFVGGSEETLHIVNTYSRQQLIQLIREYGEERYADRIAGAIVRGRNSETDVSEGRSAPVIRTAKQLADIIASAVPAAARHGRIHPATRTFQALRIATNDELARLQMFLEQSLQALAPGGRLVVVSYHSLEDRIVKQFFKQASRDCICPPQIPVCRCEHRAQLNIITKRVVRPQDEEVERNPRARSARLRAAQKI